MILCRKNKDDCTGELLGYTQEILFNNRALDVFFTPIYMKKNRPAYRMTVVCKKEDMANLQKIIFRETTTIGIRYRHEYRTVLKRKMIELDTKYGKIDGETYIYPEYENIKEIALNKGIPLKELYKLDELNTNK